MSGARKSGFAESVRLRAVLLAVALLSLPWGFREMFLHHAPDMFSSPEEDMSYAWYVPIFSLYVIWSERRRIIDGLSSPSVFGLLCSLPFLAVGFIGVRGIQLRFEILAFAGLLVTLPWAFFGRETARRMLFPALFLLFCMPFTSYLDVVTVHLRLLSTSVAYGALKGFGADIVRNGTSIAAADGSFSIDIADPCSGLRSLFALMALTAAYAYFNQKTWLRRGVLFALSIPIAVAGNVARILTICLAAAYADPEFATGFYHDYSGYVVFAVAIALMVAAGELLSRAGKRLERPRPEPASEAVRENAPRAERSPLLRSLDWAVVAFSCGLTLCCMIVQERTPEVTLCEPPHIEFAQLPGFTSEEIAPSEAELNTLPKDTVFVKRRYFNAAGDWYLVSAVIGGRSKMSIHRPELCLPSQGFLMADPRTVAVGDFRWRFITLARGGRPEMGFAYTFFNQAGFRTSSHVSRIFRDVVDRSLHNRIDRWVMITVNSSRCDDASLAEFLSRIGEMLP